MQQKNKPSNTFFSTYSEPLPQFTMLQYASTLYAIIVCLCVYWTMHFIKMAKSRTTHTMPHDSPGTFKFYIAIDLGKMEWPHPQWEHQMYWIKLKLETFDK